MPPIKIQTIWICIQNIKHGCTFVDLWHLCVRDSLLCLFICTWIPINSNGWLGHLIGSVNCDVTGPLLCHQKAVSCLGWDYKNPLHLDVVDRYLRRMGDKTIPDEAPPSLESFYPHESQVSIYHNQGVVDSLSRSPIKTNKGVFWC